MTVTAYHRERDAVVLIRDHGPLTLNPAEETASNAGGSAELATIHALERKLFVFKNAGRFELTAYGIAAAANFPSAPSPKA